MKLISKKIECFFTSASIIFDILTHYSVKIYVCDQNRKAFIRSERMKFSFKRIECVQSQAYQLLDFSVGETVNICCIIVLNCLFLMIIEWPSQANRVKIKRKRFHRSLCHIAKIKSQKQKPFIKFEKRWRFDFFDVKSPHFQKNLLSAKGQQSNFLAAVISYNCTMSICSSVGLFVCVFFCLFFHMLTTSIKIRLNVTRREKKNNQQREERTHYKKTHTQKTERYSRTYV